MTAHLVAGAAGFLGSHLVDRLLARGDRVIGVDNLLTGNRSNLEAAERSPRFAFLQHDVTRPLAIAEPVDRVWNLASPASPPDYLRFPIETLVVGAVGTKMLLDLAQTHGARFLLASTSEVYGDPAVSPQSEDYWGHVNPIGPRSVYDEAKRFAEATTTAYARTLGADVRIARIFNTYGPRMRLDDGRVIPNFIGQALRREPLTIYGDGKQTRSFCYVDDLVDGLLRLMEADVEGPVNIGNPREMTILDLATTIERLLGRALPYTRLPLPADDPRQRRPDTARAAKLLGWTPRIPLEEGLTTTLAWYLSGSSR